MRAYEEEKNEMGDLEKKLKAFVECGLYRTRIEGDTGRGMFGN